MNLINKINQTTLNVAKGILTLFSLKLFLLLGIFIFNSCQSETDELELPDSSKDFKTALYESINNLNSIKVSNMSVNSLNRDLTLEDNTQTICLSFQTSELTETTVEEIENTETIGELSSLNGNLTSINGDDINDSDEEDNTSTTNGNGNDSIEYCFEISNQNAQESVDIAYSASKNYLYNFGFTDEEFTDEFGDDNENNVMMLAMVVIDKIQNNQVNNRGGGFGHCIMEATGINAITALGNAWWALNAGDVAAGWAVSEAQKRAFRKAAFAAAKKVITRVGGGVFGAAVMLVQFVNCMSE